MKTINKFLLVTVIFFMLSVTAVSASDNITSDNQDTLDVQDSSVTTATTQIAEKTDVKTTTDSNKISNSEDKNTKQAPVVNVITSKNYKKGCPPCKNFPNFDLLHIGNGLNNRQCHKISYKGK